MHTRSKGTLDKKVLNEYPEDQKKKDTKKESISVEPVEFQAIYPYLKKNSRKSFYWSFR